MNIHMLIHISDIPESYNVETRALGEHRPLPKWICSGSDPKCRKMPYLAVL